MKKLFVTCLAIALLTTLTAPAPADDWPFFRGPDLTGVSKETGWQAKFGSDGPPVAWKASVGTGAAGIVVAGDKVITSSNQNNEDVVHCFSASTGKTLWTHRFPCKFDKRMFDGGTASTPTIDGDHVYNLAYDGQLMCLRLADGKPVWTKHVVRDFGGKPSRWMYAGSPLVLGNLVILDIGGNGNSTIALNKKTGAKVWGAGNDNAGYATPIPFKVGSNTGLLVFKGTAMIGVDARNGRELFRVPWKTSYDVNASTPTVLGSTFFLSSGYGGGRGALYSIGSRGVKQVWLNNDMKTKMSSAVVDGGVVYGISQKNRGVLLAMDLKSGRTLWQESGFGYGRMTLAGGKLIALTEGGELVIAEASGAGFKPLTRARVLNGKCWVAPVLANGRIYCKNNAGQLVCLNVSGAKTSE